jgi:hypothetical protein
MIKFNLKHTYEGVEWVYVTCLHTNTDYTQITTQMRLNTPYCRDLTRATRNLGHRINVRIACLALLSCIRKKCFRIYTRKQPIHITADSQFSSVSPGKCSATPTLTGHNHVLQHRFHFITHTLHSIPHSQRRQQLNKSETKLLQPGCLPCLVAYYLRISSLWVFRALYRLA